MVVVVVTSGRRDGGGGEEVKHDGLDEKRRQREREICVLSSMFNKFVLNKEFSRMAKAVANQTVDNYYKPDLKKTALARRSVISKGLRVAKSHPKKRNMQA
ncbi:hypothetical protein YC2023_024149 [Brassica napus]